MIRGLWDRQDGSIIDVKLGNYDVYSYKYEAMVVLLAWWETSKKYKHVNHYHDQQ